jgi:hypothetical protein
LEEHKKISYKREVDGHGIEIIIWDKDQFMNAKEWEYALRKYSTFIIQGKMGEHNLNDINYFKDQTITDFNSGNKTGLHDAVVENVDGVIYLVEKEGVNLQEDTTFNNV